MFTWVMQDTRMTNDSNPHLPHWELDRQKQINTRKQLSMLLRDIKITMHRELKELTLRKKNGTGVSWGLLHLIAYLVEHLLVILFASKV